MSQLSKKQQEKLVKTLGRLGGTNITDDEIEHTGTKIILPKNMSVRDARVFLKSYQEREEKVHSFSREFRARPWDGAAAVERALTKLFGHAGLPRGRFSFFGESPPNLVTINIGVDETIQVPWGELEVPLLEAVIHFGQTQDAEYGQIFAISVNAPRKYRTQVEGLFKLIEQELREHSIYRGKAITGQDTPEFLDLTRHSEQVVYDEATRTDLEANIWSLLEYTDVHRQENLPLKRAVLLHGEYGTGKTITAYHTARRAVENGWGFVMCRPGQDNLENVFKTARLLQPCVVFFEDVDTVMKHGDNQDLVSRVLELFDGLSAKGTELLVILTTNHPGDVHKALYRPGRIGAVIELGKLDGVALRDLITQTVKTEYLDDDIDWEQVEQAYRDYTPAWVVEAAERVRRYSVVANKGEMGKITTATLVQAAHSLTKQQQMMTEAVDRKHTPPVEEALSSVVVNALDKSELVYDAAEDKYVLSAGNGGN